MRRKDREKDASFAWNVFDTAQYCVLATVNPDGSPYCIPLSSARNKENVIYFHGAKEGHKITNILNNPHVCITCSTNIQIVEEKFTVEYDSCVIEGKAEIVQDNQEKIEALRVICEKYTPHTMGQFSHEVSGSLSNTCIFKVITHNITGKSHQKKESD